MAGIDSKGSTDYFALTGVLPPKPLPDFDIDKALPRPYRPFRWKYHQTMSFQAMDPDWWLELECTYRERIAQRKRLYAQHGRNIIDMMPGSENACTELAEMVIQFLCVRYPNQFSLDSSGIFHNRILGRSFDTKGVKMPLELLLENVPEDFLLVQEDKETGLYHFCAGVSASAVGWNMSMKIGKALHDVHGPVPYYKEKLQHSMDRYFVKMPCDKPIQRGSWSLEVGQPLYMQADDIHWAARSVQDPNLDINDIYLRVDWQTLRRLPKSRAIVFNFKALFTPVIHFREEPFIPHLVGTVLREAEKPFMEYKSTFHIAHKVIPALEVWAREQEEKGWVPKDWASRTLEENPFYPGWQLHHRY
ncbi:hypothetical protein AGABI2DRAFT_63838 [Agaricus bisporus var. bisporus H97]|uniref:hypothetical protein n=1 Tax=Agaricus bisporus var. bisporus (strain H97 / ATCC MYA-4626 / FGSC 10389) TaxID=936046 RepID=UPI00029F5496|nr:hypothetical protein AGABI2DRAFT_63838 [Agaricus bisporus var. bisporus H97]EKV50230.1 hypothetical protein AGABI2DRAFT_63838 [Agaricus bisporus var. bisporus H97]